MITTHFPGPQVKIGDCEYIYFGGTSYLGMASHPEFQAILFKALQRWGTAYGSSRNSNVKLSIYKEAEAYLSSLVGSESCLAISSGTMAGQLLMTYLDTQYQQFYHYPKTHPAIRHSKSQPLYIDDLLNPDLRSSKLETVVVCVDAIVSLDVEPVQFDFLDDIPVCKKVVLLIDESHSLGIVGSKGQGIFKSIAAHPRLKDKLMISSLSKALGCSGGMIAGSSSVLKAIQNHDLFVSASAANPAFLQALLWAKPLIDEQYIRLQEHLAFFFEDFVIHPLFKWHKNYPVIYCFHPDIYEFLKRHHILISNFKYPNYEEGMNRIVLSAHHSIEDLQSLKAALLLFQKENPSR